MNEELEKIIDEDAKLRVHSSLRKQALENYYSNPNHCKYCGNIIYVKQYETPTKTRKRQFCSIECKDLYSRQQRKLKNTHVCLCCGKEYITSDKRSKYCSTECNIEYNKNKKISDWKSGKWNGLVGVQWIDVSNTIKKYIFEKYNFKCAICGWHEINQYTGTLPLEIEHIDGDATNNKEENLTLLCPNCHSLTPTYRGANKGNGKRNITWLSRSDKSKQN